MTAHIATAAATRTAPAGYVTPRYDGAIFVRGDVVRHTDPQGRVTVGRVRRVAVVRGYYEPSVVTDRYLAIESLEGILVSSTECVAAGAR